MISVKTLKFFIKITKNNDFWFEMILILQYSGCIDGTFHNRGIEKSNKYKSKFTCQCLNRTLPSRKCSNKEDTHAKSVKSVYDLTEICIQLSKRLDPLCLLSVRIFFHEFVYYCCCFEKTHKYDMHFMIVVKCMYVRTTCHLTLLCVH